MGKKKKKIYKVLICGDRTSRPAYVRILKREILKLVNKHGASKLVIIEGGAPGVDVWAGQVGRKLNVHVCEVKALWDIRGISAGPQRNEIMAALEPDEVIGIHAYIDESVGTAGMLELADKLGIPNRLVKA